MSDVLVKGMRMPENCAECQWEIRRLPIGEHLCICSRTHENIPDIYGKRPEACPLVELPPYGRLIDSDAEIKAWEQTKIALRECNQERTFAFKEACIAIKVLSDAPTVLEANNGHLD